MVAPLFQWTCGHLQHTTTGTGTRAWFRTPGAGLRVHQHQGEYDLLGDAAERSGVLNTPIAFAVDSCEHGVLQRAWLCPDLAFSPLVTDDQGGETYDSPPVRQ
jgi:hypothetical protein